MPEAPNPGDRSPAQREADHASLARLSDTLVPALVQKLNASGLGELEVREGNWRIRLESGVMICMTSQCIWGRIRMTVYDTGRDLLNIGVIPLSDMTSETAIVKAMWVLANTKEIESAKKMMQENIANEISRVIPITDKRI